VKALDFSPPKESSEDLAIYIYWLGKLSSAAAKCAASPTHYQVIQIEEPLFTGRIQAAFSENTVDAMNKTGLQFSFEAFDFPGIGFPAAKKYYGQVFPSLPFYFSELVRRFVQCKICNNFLVRS
jgi:hypothetical protein